MPNNILITPGSASIDFSGSMAGNTLANTLRLQVLSDASVVVTGSVGEIARFFPSGQVWVTSSAQSSIAAHQFTGSLGIVAFVGTASRVTDGAYLSEAQTFTALKTFSAGIALSDSNITGVGSITINDPGVGEGILWAGGNLWRIYESPNTLTNAAGNLQIVQNTTRRATFNTSGQLEIPVATGTAPFLISSTTLVTNLNADLLDGYNTATTNTANTVVIRDGSGNFSAGTITAYLAGYADAVDSNDTRATNDTPSSRNSGVYFDFKQNSTNGLSDGGTYNGQMTWRSYGSSTDLSGGQPIQIAYTANARIWTRIGTGASTWASWQQLLNSVDQIYAYNMNQNVRTTDTVTFAGVYLPDGGNVGINDAGFDVYINFSDSNPTYYGDAYGGVFTFYGDKSVDSAFLDFGGAQVRRTLQAGSSLRAPIFYDSIETGYYLDPNSTTNIRYLKVNTTGTSSGTRALTIKNDGQAEINFGAYPASWTSALQIQNNNNTDIIWISPLDDGYNARFRTGGSGLDFYTDGTTTDGGTHSAFIGSGYIEGITKVRGPFFEDSNNSAWYADPASTSRLNILNLTGYGFVVGQTTNGQSFYQWEGATYRNPGDHTPSLLIREDNASTGINGFMPALALYNANGGDQTTVGLTFVSAEGATGAGNSVNLAGIIAKKEAAGNVGGWSPGSLTFFVKNYGTRIDAMYIGSNGNVGINNTSIPYKLTVGGDIYADGGWLRVSGSQGLYFESYGGGWRMTDSTWIRSYGSKNVYVDTYIRAQGSFRVGSEYSIWATYGTYSAYLTRMAYISFDWNANYDYYYYHGIASTDLNGSFTDSMSINSFNDIILRIDSNNNNTNSYVRFMDNTSGNNQFAYIGRENGSAIAYFGGAVYGSIFYDTSGTYYLDPNSTSILWRPDAATQQRWNMHYRALDDGGHRPNLTGDSNYWTTTHGWGTSYGNWNNMWKYGFAGLDVWGTSTGHPQGSGYVHAQGINSGLHYATSDGGSAYGWQMVGAADAGSRWWLRGKWGGTTYAWYEIMLYDRNIGGGTFYAGYWADGNNTGYYVDPNGGSRMDRIYVNGGDSYGAFYFYSNLGGYAGSLSGPGLQVYSSSNNSAFMSFHKGGYYAVNMGLDADNVLRIGGWSASANRWELDMSGNNWVASSFRAPIFYDSNDTGGYLDPREPTNGLRFYSAAGWWQLRGATHWDSQPGIDLSGGTSEFRISSTGGNVNLRVDGWMYAYDSSYFPFIYDQQNTGYYLDPNGSSQLAAVFANDWFRPQGCTGVYWQSYGRGIWSPECAGSSYGTIATYGGGRNGWAGYAIESRWVYMSTGGDNVGVHDNSRGNWLWYWDGGYTRWNFGYNYFAGDVRSWRFYDHDTNYYFDGNDNSNWVGLTGRGKAMIGETYKTNWKRPDITGDTNYWVGSMGWGAYDMYSIMDWGSGFFDTWSGANYPPGYGHWTGVQAYHYSNGYNSAYGWQLVGGPASGAWFKSSWPNSRPWYKIAMYGLSEYSNDFYSTIMYDANNGGYYIDPDNFSRLNRIDPNEIYNYGWFRNHNSGQGMYNQSSGMHWYSNNGYWKAAGGGYGYGGIQFFVNYESAGRGYVYWDGNGFGFLDRQGSWAVNIHPDTANRITLSGGNFWNAYNSASGMRLMFRGGDDDAAGNYYIGTNIDCYNGCYNKLELRWHTGIRIGAQTYYGGIRMYNTEDMDSLILQVGGSSEYIFKYRWMYTTTAGFYSDANGAHWHPNENSSYGSWNLHGSRSGWTGMKFQTGGSYQPHLMFDCCNNGGLYYESTGRWGLYYHHDNNCLGVGTSYTQNNFGIWTDRAIAANMLNLSNYNKDSYTKPGAIAIGRTDYNYDAYWQNPNAAGMQTHCADTFEWAMHDSGAAWWSAFYYTSYGYMVIGRNIGWGANNVWAGGTFYNGWSDERLKTEITVIENPIEKLKQIRGVYYVPNDLAKDLAKVAGDPMTSRKVGVLAQDVEKVLPEIVTIAAFDLHGIDENGKAKSRSGLNYMTIEYDKMIPLLIEAIKEQQKMIEELQNRLNSL